jgi:hypothetical protein
LFLAGCLRIGGHVASRFLVAFVSLYNSTTAEVSIRFFVIDIKKQAFLDYARILNREK